MLDFTPSLGNKIFVTLIEDSLYELVSYLTDNTESAIVWIDFKRVSENTPLSLIRLSGQNLKAIYFENNSSFTNLFEDVISLESINVGFDKSGFDFGKLVRLTSVGGVWSKNWVQCFKTLN